MGPLDPGDPPPRKYVLGNNVTVAVAREPVQYLSADGKLITDSLRDYTRINLTRRYDSLDKFLQAWNSAERKAALLAELESHGVLFEALADEMGHKDLDAFDLLVHIAWHQPLQTRRQRAIKAKQRAAFERYGPLARRVIDALIDKYADHGIASIESDSVLTVQPFTQIGSPAELVRSFGGRAQYLDALRDVEQALYSNATASAQPPAQH